MDLKLTITEEDPGGPDGMLLMGELSSRLREITGCGGEASFDAEDVRGDRAVFLVARDGDHVPQGCGAFRPLDGSSAEIKRMYARVPGIGSSLLAELEGRAWALGYTSLRLETRRVNERAVRFYLREGYRVIDNYGKYRGKPEAVCFEKSLVSPSPVSPAGG